MLYLLSAPEGRCHIEKHCVDPALTYLFDLVYGIVRLKEKT